MGTADPSSRGRVHNRGFILKIFGFLALFLAVAGCNATTCSTANCEAAPVAVVPADLGPATTAKLQDPDDVKYYRSDEPLRMAIEHFNRGHYGIAERYFRDATEKALKDPAAWTALPRPMTGLRASILPIAPMFSLSGLWGRPRRSSTTKATAYATG